MKNLKETLKELSLTRESVYDCSVHSGTDSTTELEHIDGHVDAAVEDLKALIAEIASAAQRLDQARITIGKVGVHLATDPRTRSTNWGDVKPDIRDLGQAGDIVSDIARELRSSG